jgi:hypothetical protein
MSPVVLSILSGLFTNGLETVGKAVIDKGVDYVEDKLGVELKPQEDSNDEDYENIRVRAMEHEEFKINAATQLAMNESDNLSKRHVADMSSDSWLSKNVRPLSLLFVFVSYIVFAGLSAASITINEAYVKLLGDWGMLIFSFYFGSRGVEKVFDIIHKNRDKAE